MQKVLGPAFFNRPTLVVARELLGKFLVRRVKGEPHAAGKTVAMMITETEAYDGFKDLASHAHCGKTVRNTPMFAEAGTIYVYFTYGMHWMLNLVCGERGYPAAVLIRAIAPDPTFSLSQESQNILVRLDGPAKLTKYLAIDKSLSAKTLGKRSGLWVEDRGVVIKPRDIKRTPRIGINYAGKYVHKPWRFVRK